jgi:GR25 family glycosyltransferase involved in LPS biosynthesis
MREDKNMEYLVCRPLSRRVLWVLVLVALVLIAATLVLHRRLFVQRRRLPSVSAALEKPAFRLWKTGDELTEQVLEKLSLDRKDHCLVVVGLEKTPRSPGLAQVVQWFAHQPNVLHLQGVSEVDLKDAYRRDIAETGSLAERQERVFAFTGPVKLESIDAQVACSVSHLLALLWVRSAGCRTALLLEDDASLEILPLWESNVADLAAAACTKDRPVLQMELKLVSLLRAGYSEELKLETLGINCTARFVLPHIRHLTYGTAAYAISALGAEQILQRFRLDASLSTIDVNKVIQSGGVADVDVIYNKATTRVLWPPYFFEYGDAKSYLTGQSKKEWYYLSASKAIEANLERAALCRLFS